jgi:hypothetical protein
MPIQMKGRMLLIAYARPGKGLTVPDVTRLSREPPYRRNIRARVLRHMLALHVEQVLVIVPSFISWTRVLPSELLRRQIQFQPSCTTQDRCAHPVSQPSTFPLLGSPRPCARALPPFSSEAPSPRSPGNQSG